MALIEFTCKTCGWKGEELVKADGKYPPCPVCGAALTQVYAGKCYTGTGKGGGNCTGNCSSCGGCH